MEEAAIEAATDNIKKKMKKTHTQHCESKIKTKKQLRAPCQRCSTEKNEKEKKSLCCCDRLAQELEAGRRSPILMRRKYVTEDRPSRQGVSERNPTEGKLVTEAMKYLKIQENLDEWNIVHH